MTGDEVLRAREKVLPAAALFDVIRGYKIWHDPYCCPGCNSYRQTRGKPGAMPSLGCVTRQEVADRMGVTLATFNKWLSRGRMFTIDEAELYAVERARVHPFHVWGWLWVDAVALWEASCDAA